MIAISNMISVRKNILEDKNVNSIMDCDKKFFDERRKKINHYIFQSRLTIFKNDEILNERKLYSMIIEQKNYDFSYLPYYIRNITIKRFVSFYNIL